MDDGGKGCQFFSVNLLTSCMGGAHATSLRYSVTNTTSRACAYEGKS